MKSTEYKTGKRHAVHDSSYKSIVSVKMSIDTFRRFSSLIQKRCGIKMPDIKIGMLESRLRRRLRHLGMRSFEEYWDYLSSEKGMELEFGPMVDVVTTNKTGFFREDAHFAYLFERTLPELQRLKNSTNNGNRREFKVWSAGCSSGEEPYTLAMMLEEYARVSNGLEYRILATDISMRVLEAGQRAVYRAERVADIPERMMKKYIMRSKDRDSDLVRVVPELRKKVTFAHLNFFENFTLSTQFDIIFCRNVIIYFERERQRELLHRICNYLVPGGYLFTGHSETLHTMGLHLVPQAPSVYRKPLQD